MYWQHQRRAALQVRSFVYHAASHGDARIVLPSFHQPAWWIGADNEKARAEVNDYDPNAVQDGFRSGAINIEA